MSRPPRHRRDRTGIRGRVAGPRVPLAGAIVAVHAVLALALVAGLLAAEGVILPGTDSPFLLRVAFPDAGGLKDGDRDQVTVAGVPAGHVRSVRYRDGDAEVTLALDGDLRGRVHSGARAQVVPRSVLGDLTVDLTAGDPAAPALAPGARVAAAADGTPVAPDRIADVLDADTRAQVEVLLAELRTGVAGHAGPLAGDIARLARLTESGGAVARLLARRRVLVRRLVHGLSGIVDSLGRRDRALAGALASGRRTLAVTAGRDRELAAAVRLLPSAAGGARVALDRLRTLAVPLRRALARVRPVAAGVPAAARSAVRALPAFAAALDQVGVLARAGTTPLRDLAIGAEQVPATASKALPAIRDLAPITRAINRHRSGIGLLGERFSGVFSTNDAGGPILRGLGTFEPFDPANFGFPGATGAARARVAAGVVRALVATCLHGNHLACLVRYLVPGLPGAVRSIASPLGSAALARRTLAALGRGGGR